MVRTILPLLLAASAALAAPPLVTHDATITFDLDDHKVVVTDHVTVEGAGGPVRLDRACLDKSLTSELAGETHDLPLPVDRPLRYSFVAHQSTEGVRFSRENVGGEITATVSDEGIWLSGGAAWLATVADGLHAGRFVVDTPAGWFPVMSGRMVGWKEADGRRQTTYEIALPVDGLPLVAAPYSITERVHGDVTMRTCLLEPDEQLRDTYLTRTAAYLDLYEEMIGPYPYDAFTTVENWFPTGYGMPGWTLLGAQVIRLPFIPYTSFGHEIAHNWWGNSVFVDPSEGNWCEGLTVYCADYEYKRRESADAARDYRRNQLKDYAAYVGGHPEREFALAAFTDRHSGATRAIGYGKSMMIWHMLEVDLGREAVLAALQRVYREHLGEPATWSDLFAALEAESDRDLAWFRAQWVDRAGAPTISLHDAEATADGATFTLRQSGETYDLRVPVSIASADGEVRRAVHLTQAEQCFTVPAPGATTVSVDPDYDVFRRLHPAEVEPTISRVLASEGWLFSVPPDDTRLQRQAEEFARAFCECDDPEFTTTGRRDPQAATVVINPSADALAGYAPPELSFDGMRILLDGQTFGRYEHDLVFAATGPDGRTDLVVLTADPEALPGLGRRLPHYGKYSWLALPTDGGRPVRGNWRPHGGPLQAALRP